MSPESQRIALAEACGYQWVKPATGHWPPRRFMSKTACQDDRLLAKADDPLDEYPLYGVPDYLNDLNAINQAEQHLITESNYFDFLNNLHTVMGRPQNGAWPIRGTAAQRSEALLKTCGLWEGGVA